GLTPARVGGGREAQRAGPRMVRAARRGLLRVLRADQAVVARKPIALMRWLVRNCVADDARDRVPEQEARELLAEPVFGHTKFNRRVDRFQLKLWKHTAAPQAA
ncbi:MAG: hypothetical protein LC808_29205, partial [Actinobacteria bacterium]|nr:hypothetical protein [Actinomycetota bacterium]